MEENKMTGHESLSVINEMIQRLKSDYHESGTSALLWGSVVGLAGIISFLQMHFGFSIGFDIWLMVLLAVIPQVVISIRENKKRQYKTYTDAAIDTVWITFGITIFGLLFYGNIIPSATGSILQKEGWQLVKHYTDGSRPDETLQPFVPSLGSLFLLIYALPTLITGVITKSRPMLWGAVICYVLFAASCFTVTKYDMLFAGIAGIFAWFIPGLILRKNFIKVKKTIA